MSNLLQDDFTMCKWDQLEVILKDHQLGDFLQAIIKAM